MLTGKITPQPSERWAIYRMICPIVDSATAASGLVSYFEFSQPNGPNKRLSADIALLNNNKPVWLIEAKKFGKKLDPGLIAPYLTDGVMGVVTNGNYWIFVICQKIYVAGPVLSEHGEAIFDIQTVIISLLSQTNEDAAASLACKTLSAWSGHIISKRPTVWTLNKGLGSREFAKKVIYNRLSDAVLEVLPLVVEGSPTELLLEELQQSGAEIPGGRIEVSKNRLVWWLQSGARAIRLNLKSRQIDMLASNRLIEAVGKTLIRASIKMHDKNYEMSVLRATEVDEVRSLVALFSKKIQ